jgi:alkyl sulfatase BDS1-like metallo-beta-lactamase superfamily hydrolase
VTPDNGEQFAIELSNATLTNIKGYQAEDADLTLTINRAHLEETMMGAKPLAAQIADGTAKVRGDASILEKLASTLVEFEVGFEIMPGTAGPVTKEDLDPYEVGPIDIHGE